MTQVQRSGTTSTVSLIFGTVATPLRDLKASGGPADAPTNQWTVYVRNANGQCISPWVSEVVFNIHETFTQPRRVITQPPYAVTEVGWGEFTIVVDVHLHPSCGGEPPISIHVPLKLFVKPTELPHGVKMSDKLYKKPIFNEIIEEIVIINPPVEFDALLKISKQQQQIPHFDLVQWFFLHHEYNRYQNETNSRLNEVRTFTRLQTQGLLNQLYSLRSQVEVLQQCQRAQNDGSSNGSTDQHQQQEQQQITTTTASTNHNQHLQPSQQHPT